MCDLLHSIFKYVATQGKLVIRSKRSPLFSPVSVCELLEAPKVGKKSPGIFFFHCESETIITNKHYFITGFLGDNVVKEKNIVWYCILSNCLAFELVNRWVEGLPLALTECTNTAVCYPGHPGEFMSWCDWLFFWFPLSYPNIWT